MWRASSYLGIIVSGAALLASVGSNATVIYDGGAPDQGGQIYAQSPNPVAMTFTLAPGSTTANDAHWWGGCFPATTCGGSPDFTITFYNNASGAPGSIITSFDVGSANQTATGLVIGPPTTAQWDEYSYGVSFADLSFSANTTYWFGITENLAEPSGTWGLETTSSAPAGEGAASFGLIVPNQWSTVGSLAFQLTDSVVAVPEPGSLLLFGAGLAGCLLLSMRERQSSRKNVSADTP